MALISNAIGLDEAAEAERRLQPHAAGEPGKDEDA